MDYLKAKETNHVAFPSDVSEYSRKRSVEESQRQVELHLDVEPLHSFSPKRMATIIIDTAPMNKKKDTGSLIDLNDCGSSNVTSNSKRSRFTNASPFSQILERKTSTTNAGNELNFLSVAQKFKLQAKPVNISMGVTKSNELDPSNREFPYPDFGFEDELNSGHIHSIWQLIQDHISPFPKYERFSNFIKERTQTKLEKIQKHLDMQKNVFNSSGAYSSRMTDSITNFSQMAKAVSSNQSRNRMDFDGFMDLDHKENLLKEAQKMMIEDKARLERIGLYEKLLAKSVDHKMSEEEAEFMKLEKFVNPITGEKGQKVSSEQLKLLWINLKQILNDVITSQNKLKQLKFEWEKQTIEEEIEETQGILEDTEQAKQSKSKYEADYARRKEQSQKKKLVRLRSKISRMNKLQAVAQAINVRRPRAGSETSSPSALFRQRTRVDNHMNKRFIVKENTALREVPNFVKLNAQRRSVAVVGSQMSLQEDLAFQEWQKRQSNEYMIREEASIASKRGENNTDMYDYSNYNNNKEENNHQDIPRSLLADTSKDKGSEEKKKRTPAYIVPVKKQPQRRFESQSKVIFMAPHFKAKDLNSPPLDQKKSRQRPFMKGIKTFEEEPKNMPTKSSEKVQKTSNNLANPISSLDLAKHMQSVNNRSSATKLQITNLSHESLRTEDTPISEESETTMSIQPRAKDARRGSVQSSGSIFLDGYEMYKMEKNQYIKSLHPDKAKKLNLQMNKLSSAISPSKFNYQNYISSKRLGRTQSMGEIKKKHENLQRLERGCQEICKMMNEAIDFLTNSNMKVKRSDMISFQLFKKREYSYLHQLSNDSLHPLFSLLISPIVFKQDRINSNRKTILKFMRYLRTHVGYLIQDKKFKPKDLFRVGNEKDQKDSKKMIPNSSRVTNATPSQTNAVGGPGMLAYSAAPNSSSDLANVIKGGSASVPHLNTQLAIPISSQEGEILNSGRLSEASKGKPAGQASIQETETYTSIERTNQDTDDTALLVPESSRTANPAGVSKIQHKLFELGKPNSLQWQTDREKQREQYYHHQAYESGGDKFVTSSGNRINANGFIRQQIALNSKRNSANAIERELQKKPAVLPQVKLAAVSLRQNVAKQERKAVEQSLREFLYKKQEEPKEGSVADLKNRHQHKRQEWNFHSQLNKKSMRFTMSNFKIVHDNSLRARMRHKGRMTSYQRLLAEKTDSDAPSGIATSESHLQYYPPVQDQGQLFGGEGFVWDEPNMASFDNGAVQQQEPVHHNTSYKGSAERLSEPRLSEHFLTSRYSVDGLPTGGQKTALPTGLPEPSMPRNTNVYQNQMVDYFNSDRRISGAQTGLTYPARTTRQSPKKRKPSKFRANSHLDLISKKRNSHQPAKLPPVAQSYDLTSRQHVLVIPSRDTGSGSDQSINIQVENSDFEEMRKRPLEQNFAMKKTMANTRFVKASGLVAKSLIVKQAKSSRRQPLWSEERKKGYTVGPALASNSMSVSEFPYVNQ